MMPGDVFSFCKIRSRSRRSLSGYVAGAPILFMGSDHFHQLLEVRAIDDKSPLLVLLYKPVKPTPAKRLLDGISPFIAPSTPIISVSTTELERKMFLELVS